MVFFDEKYSANPKTSAVSELFNHDSNSMPIKFYGTHKMISTAPQVDPRKRQLIDSAHSIGLPANLQTIRQQHRFPQRLRLIAMDGV